jgi:hypothetical protein
VFGNDYSKKNDRGESKLSVPCEIIDPVALQKEDPLMETLDSALACLPTAVVNAWLNWINPDLTGAGAGNTSNLGQAATTGAGTGISSNLGQAATTGASANNTGNLGQAATMTIAESRIQFQLLNAAAKRKSSHSVQERKLANMRYGKKRPVTKLWWCRAMKRKESQWSCCGREIKWKRSQARLGWIATLWPTRYITDISSTRLVELGMEKLDF